MGVVGFGTLFPDFGLVSATHGCSCCCSVGSELEEATFCGEMLAGIPDLLSFESVLSSPVFFSEVDCSIVRVVNFMYTSGLSVSRTSRQVIAPLPWAASST